MGLERDGNPLKQVEEKQLLDINSGESASTKLLRAADLIAKGSSDGFVNRAKEAIVNPVATTIEVATAAAAGAALAGLQRMGGAYALSGKLIGLGLAGVAANDIYQRGKDAAPAIADTWNSSSNFDANKTVIARSLGSALFDYPVMALSGYAGYKGIDFARSLKSVTSFELPAQTVGKELLRASDLPKQLLGAELRVPSVEPLRTASLEPIRVAGLESPQVKSGQVMSPDRIAALMRELRPQDISGSLSARVEPTIRRSESALKLEPVNFRNLTFKDITVKQTNVFVPAILPTYLSGMDGSSQEPIKFDSLIEPSGSMRLRDKGTDILEFRGFSKEWKTNNPIDKGLIDGWKSEFVRPNADMIIRKGQGTGLRKDQLPKELRDELVGDF